MSERFCPVMQTAKGSDFGRAWVKDGEFCGGPWVVRAASSAGSGDAKHAGQVTGSAAPRPSHSSARRYLPAGVAPIRRLGTTGYSTSLGTPEAQSGVSQERGNV